jgi:hypothetical protein
VPRDIVLSNQYRARWRSPIFPAIAVQPPQVDIQP